MTSISSTALVLYRGSDGPRRTLRDVSASSLPRYTTHPLIAHLVRDHQSRGGTRAGRGEPPTSTAKKPFAGFWALPAPVLDAVCAGLEPADDAARAQSSKLTVMSERQRPAALQVLRRLDAMVEMPTDAVIVIHAKTKDFELALVMALMQEMQLARVAMPPSLSGAAPARERVPTLIRMHCFVAILGSPPDGKGNSGSGALGITLPAEAAAAQARLQQVAQAFGYSGFDASAPLPEMLLCLANHAKTKDDIVAVYGRAADASGNGGSGLRALQGNDRWRLRVHLRSPPFARLMKDLPPLRF